MPDPPAPPGAPYPAVPVLVLNGDLDVITPLADAARAAALFPSATLVRVENAVHVTALADFDHCAEKIVRGFLRTLAPGDTSCAGTLAEQHVVDALPAPHGRRARGRRRPPATASRPLDRRAAWVAAHALADATSRWWLMNGSRGRGPARRLVHRRRRLLLRARRSASASTRARFARDLAVTGTGAWDRRAAAYRARIRVTGARRGTLRIALVDRRARRRRDDRRPARRPARCGCGCRRPERRG